MTSGAAHDVLTIVAAVGCGLMAGLFFAFSSFVMKALARRPAAEAMAAMQSINTAILNPAFAVVFFGTAVACVLAVGSALTNWGEPGTWYELAGGALYLFGGMLVTFVFNIPRNNALGAADPTATDSAALWADYLSEWTAWNHVRTIASLLAAAALTIAVGHQGARW